MSEAFTVDRTAALLARQWRRSRLPKPPAELVPFLLAGSVGLVAGLVAVAVSEGVDALSELLLGDLGGWLTDQLGGRWALLLIPAVFGLPVAFLIARYAAEAKGHGVPEVIYAIATRGGRIALRVPIVKGLASILTIGAGGSAGREGPIVQIGSGVASVVAQLARQPAEMTTLMVAAGAAGGIAATFNAPIAGVFFALEVILRRFNVRNFTVVVVSAVLANMVAIAILGDHPPIDLGQHDLERAIEVPFYILLGLAAGVVGIVFFRVLYFAEDFFEDLPVGPYVTILAGMAAVGAIGAWRPEIFGTGFEAIESASRGDIVAGTLGLLVVLKIVATSLTLGAGASGGVFAPSLFMGSMLGALLGTGFNEIVDGIAPAGAYAVVGMAAVFAAAARAPMTSIFIVFEMTRDYSLILPLMLGVAVATALAQLITRDTIYSIKLRRRGVDMAEEPRVSVLDQLTVAEAMRRDAPLVQRTATLDEMAHAISRSRHNVVGVVDAGSRLIGLVSATDVTNALERDDPDLTAEDLAVTQMIHTYPDDTLREALTHLVEHDVSQLPVVARWDEGRLLGMLAQRDVLREVTRRGVRQAPVPRRPIRRLVGAVQLELRVPADSPLVGRAISDLAMPEQAVITAIQRGGTVVIPRGNVTLAAGDLVLLLTEPIAEPRVRALFAHDGEEGRVPRWSLFNPEVIDPH